MARPKWLDTRAVRRLKRERFALALLRRTNPQALCVECHNDKTAHEQRGARWTPPRLRGCDAYGNPLDPQHP